MCHRDEAPFNEVGPGRWAKIPNRLRETAQRWEKSLPAVVIAEAWRLPRKLINTQIEIVWTPSGQVFSHSFMSLLFARMSRHASPIWQKWRVCCCRLWARSCRQSNEAMLSKTHCSPV